MKTCKHYYAVKGVATVGVKRLRLELKGKKNEQDRPKLNNLESNKLAGFPQGQNVVSDTLHSP